MTHVKSSCVVPADSHNDSLSHFSLLSFVSEDIDITAVYCDLYSEFVRCFADMKSTFKIFWLLMLTLKKYHYNCSWKSLIFRV